MNQMLKSFNFFPLFFFFFFTCFAPQYLFSLATIEGTVTLLPGILARVELVQESQVRNSVETDSNGFYRFTNVFPGDYVLVVNGSFRAIQTIGVIAKDNETTTQDFGFVSLSDSFSLSAEIFPLSVQNGTIRVFQNSILIATATINEQNGYRIDNLPRNQVLSVVASGNNLVSRVNNLDTSSSNQSGFIRFFLNNENERIISGRIEDNLGNPIEGAWVQVSLDGVPIGFAASNNDGIYRIAGLAIFNNYVVVASKDGFQRGVGGGGNFILFPLQTTITGTVTDIDSNPIPNASVTIAIGDEIIGTILTDIAGNYIFNDVNPGSYNISASRSDYQRRTASVQISSGSTEMVNFKLELLPGSIEGQVIDINTRLPIPNVQVSLDFISTFTDQNGRYIFSNLASGDYSLAVEAIGYDLSKKGAKVVNGRTTFVNFELTPTSPGNIVGTVSGSVTGPIMGALIKITQDNLTFKSVLTDSDGHYSIEGLAPGEYIVIVNVNIHQIQDKSVIVVSNETKNVDFTLTQLIGTLKGRVIDATTGLPLESIKIDILRGQSQNLIASVLTNSNGDYQLSTLIPGNYTIRASSNSFQIKAIEAIILPSVTKTVDFNLNPLPGSILVSITNNFQIPIAGATIKVLKGQILMNQGVSGTNGEFTIAGLAPGEYFIEAYAENFEFKIQGVIVTANATTFSRLTLPASQSPGTFSGVVTDQTGNPIQGAEVLIYDDLDDIAPKNALTDEEGKYIIGNLIPGEYTLTANAKNFSIAREGGIVNANQNTVVDFKLEGKPPGDITGTVVDAITRNPIAGAAVVVHDKFVPMNTTLTDPNGIYIISNLPSGQYIIETLADNFQSFTKGVSVSSNARTIANFALNPEGINPGKIIGKVTHNGNPISGAKIFVFDGLTQVAFVITDGSGNYIVSGLAPGIYTVRVNAINFSDFYQGAQVNSNGTTTVNFNLISNPGEIQGTVLNSSGNPISGAEITVYDQVIAIAYALTDANGNYIISNLEPNNYTINAVADTFQEQTKTETINFNQTITVNFSLSPNPATIAGRVISATAGDPISSATIAIFRETTFINYTLTNDNGNYSISGLEPGNYNVLAIAKGFQLFAFKDIVATAGSTTLVNFSLSSNPGTLTGIVLDKCTGSPIPGVLVIAHIGQVIMGFGVTDPIGKYVIENLSSGNFNVFASKNHFLTDSSNVSIVAGETSVLNFSLLKTVLPPKSICGFVKKKRNWRKKEFVHVITWKASPSLCVKGYQIFRNCELIAFISSSENLKHVDPNFQNGDIYIVKSVSDFGQVSEGLCTQVHFNIHEQRKGKRQKESSECKEKICL